jgi:hypothetical protein
LVFFMAGCGTGEFACHIFNEKGFLIDIAYITTSIVFILLTYFLYLRYENKMVSKSIK